MSWITITYSPGFAGIDGLAIRETDGTGCYPFSPCIDAKHGSELLLRASVRLGLSLAPAAKPSLSCTRPVKNQRLAAAGYSWAFSAISASPGARAHYDRRKADGHRHASAQRNLFGRLLGCLHYCLATRQHYDEATALPQPAHRDTRHRSLTT